MLNSDQFIRSNIKNSDKFILTPESSYGKMGEAVSRYRKTTITTDDSKALKSSLHALCKSDDQLIAEGDLIGHELSSLKSEQDDSKPVHIAVAILQNAKLLFLR